MNKGSFSLYSLVFKYSFSADFVLFDSGKSLNLFVFFSLSRILSLIFPLSEISEILGHSKITTTQRYAHPVPQRKLDAIDVLNNYSS